MQVITRATSRQYTNVRLVGSGTNETVPVLDALKRAEDEGLDLCIVNDKSSPPVCKLQDFKKVLYEEKKSKSKQPKGQDLKEIRCRVNISDHDLATKLNQVRKFLERGDKVKISVELRGREKANPERARTMMDKILTQVSAKVTPIPGVAAMALLEPEK